MTNLSDLILDEEDEDIKNILNSTQSDPSQRNYLDLHMDLMYCLFFFS
jgi:hypothetical protein